ARRKRPQVIRAEEFGAMRPPLELVRLEVPDVQGHCEIIEGDSPGEKVATLLERLALLGVVL
ncbi:MAG TPA: hypothetical protein PJ994_05355, partial [Tepidiformaceae bacterium]|nr:hypothetical protein [Tepidiformaceae bacterium]